MMNPFSKNKQHEVIYWDITGKCNAHCKYCFTGNMGHPEGSEIDIDSFSKAFQILKSNNLIGDNTCLHLYVWGEPTLHPKLGEIISIIQNNGVHYKLSTNFGRKIDFQKNWFYNLDGIIISMCGFSQESYNKMHRLNFEIVKDNIVNLVKNATKESYDTQKIRIAHHIYQFNVEEIPDLFRFTKELNLEYHPYYAVFGDLDMAYRFTHGQLTPEEWKSVSTEIFGNQIFKRIQNNPKNGCRQFDRLVLDEYCNILTCCCLPRNHTSYKICNLFEPDFLEKLSNWMPDNNCLYCIKNGLSQYDGNGIGHFNIKNLTMG